MANLLWKNCGKNEGARSNQSSPEIKTEIFLDVEQKSGAQRVERKEKKKKKKERKEKKICNLLLTRPIPPGRNAIMQSNEIVAYA